MTTRTWWRVLLAASAAVVALALALAGNALALTHPAGHAHASRPARHPAAHRRRPLRCRVVRHGRHKVKVCQKAKPRTHAKPKRGGSTTPPGGSLGGGTTGSPGGSGGGSPGSGSGGSSSGSSGSGGSGSSGSGSGSGGSGSGSGGSPGGGSTPTPSTGKVMFDYAGNLYEVNGLGQNRTQLTQDGSASGVTEYIEPSLSLDGTRLVFQGPNSQAYTADGNAQNMRALTSGSMPTMLPRISPDGSQVMWVTTFLLEYGAEITNTIESYDGSGTAQNYSQTIGMAGFAPGGEYVCNNGAVNTITIATSAQIAANQCTQVVANDSADANARFGLRPAFSPDGTLVVDSISEDGGNTTTGLYLYDVATGQLVRQLTSGNDDLPVFSPDGSEILFNRGSDIYEVPTAGGSATLFQANGSDPTWSN